MEDMNGKGTTLYPSTRCKMPFLKALLNVLAWFLVVSHKQVEDEFRIDPFWLCKKEMKRHLLPLRIFLAGLRRSIRDHSLPLERLYQGVIVPPFITMDYPLAGGF